MSDQPEFRRIWVKRRVIGAPLRRPARGQALKFGALAALVLFCLLCFVGLFFASSQSPASGGCSLSDGSSSAGIPPEYVPWLQKAASRYELGPKGFSIVAAIHKVESDFGRSSLPGVHSGTNSAGAAGPGQFFSQPGRPTASMPTVMAGATSQRSRLDLRHRQLSARPGAPAIGGRRSSTTTTQIGMSKRCWKQRAGFGAQVHEVCTSVEGGLGELPTEALARARIRRQVDRSAAASTTAGAGATAEARPPSTGSGEFCGPGVKGLDCSGAVRWLLVLSGYPDPGGLAPTCWGLPSRRARSSGDDLVEHRSRLHRNQRSRLGHGHLQSVQRPRIRPAVERWFYRHPPARALSWA